MQKVDYKQCRCAHPKCSNYKLSIQTIKEQLSKVFVLHGIILTTFNPFSALYIKIMLLFLRLDKTMVVHFLATLALQVTLFLKRDNTLFTSKMVQLFDHRQCHKVDCPLTKLYVFPKLFQCHRYREVYHMGPKDYCNIAS